MSIMLNCRVVRRVCRIKRRVVGVMKGWWIVPGNLRLECKVRGRKGSRVGVMGRV